MRARAALIALSLLLPISAHAQTAEQPTYGSSSYGEQIILADVGSLVLGFGGTGIAGATKGGAAGGAIAVTGMFGYFVGGPTVHFAHGRVGAGIGLVGGMLGAMVIDAALLAHEDVPTEKPASAVDAKYASKQAESRAPAAFDWSPSATPVRGGATIGLTGHF
jgi:hypothetical protein